LSTAAQPAAGFSPWLNIESARWLRIQSARTRKAIVGLREAGWRVLVVWECALRGRTRREETKMLDEAAEFIKAGKVGLLEIRGMTDRLEGKHGG
jgi:G:T-mismatch repair DNA endonuclease (very short patch repair protein)